jgi:hypothetical protein
VSEEFDEKVQAIAEADPPYDHEQMLFIAHLILGQYLSGPNLLSGASLKEAVAEIIELAEANGRLKGSKDMSEWLKTQDKEL